MSDKVFWKHCKPVKENEFLPCHHPQKWRRRRKGVSKVQAQNLCVYLKEKPYLFLILLPQPQVLGEQSQLGTFLGDSPCGGQGSSPPNEDEVMPSLSSLLDIDLVIGSVPWHCPTSRGCSGRNANTIRHYMRLCKLHWLHSYLANQHLLRHT